MRYCLPYIRGSKYMDLAEEIIVPYDSKDVNFLKTLTSKETMLKNRIIIDIKDDDDFIINHSENIFLTLKEDYSHINFALRFLNYNSNMDLIYGFCLNYKIPFFFSTYVRDLDTFHGLIDLGVSDLYIVEEMGFMLDKLGPLASAAGVSIRVFANVCQSSWKLGDTVKSFFIRPEDVPIYEPYVDVIEFFGEYSRQESMYRIYSINRKWYGNLQEIITGLKVELDSRYITPLWAAARLGCQKHCLKGTPCHICKRMLDTLELNKHKKEEIDF